MRTLKFVLTGLLCCALAGAAVAVTSDLDLPKAFRSKDEIAKLNWKDLASLEKALSDWEKGDGKLVASVFEVKKKDNVALAGEVFKGSLRQENDNTFVLMFSKVIVDVTDFKSKFYARAQELWGKPDSQYNAAQGPDTDARWTIGSTNVQYSLRKIQGSNVTGFVVSLSFSGK